MLTVVTVFLVFSIVILVHEFGHFFMARRIGVKVERFSLGFGKVLLSIKRGDTEYAISAIPFGGDVKMAGEEPSDKHEGKPWEFYSKAPGLRFWVLVAGASLNYLLAFAIFCFVVPSAKVGAVIKDMPAEKAGLKTGDKIVSIDGKPVEYWHEILSIISNDTDANPISMEVERDGALSSISVTPNIIEDKNIFGKPVKKAKIGIGYYGDIKLLKANPLKMIATGARQTIDNTMITYKFIWYLITGKVSVKGTVTGPIGIVMILGKAVKVGFSYVIYLVAHINLALAIFNLLPFPVLDGGHIMFLGLEKIRKRPLGLKTQEVIQYVAIGLLIMLMLFVTYNDIFMMRFLR